VYFEQPSYNASESEEGSTKTWDLATGKGRKLFDGAAYCSFFPTGNTIAVAVNDLEAGKSELRLLDIATGKVLAKRANLEKGRFFRVDSVSPDGRFVVCHVVAFGKKTPLEVQFLDAKTLELSDRLIGQSKPDQVVWTAGKFAPDGMWYAVTDGIGNVLLWDVAERKLARTIPIGSSFPVWQLGMSVDGKTLAVAWMPQPDADLTTNPEPDPQDLPQPRVSLIALDGKTPPKILIAPHGHIGSLAFSPNGKMLAAGSFGAVHLFDLTK
jgi:WD40 repeat protein